MSYGYIPAKHGTGGNKYMVADYTTVLNYAAGIDHGRHTQPSAGIDGNIGGNEMSCHQIHF
jgi:hypothetical protein